MNSKSASALLDEIHSPNMFRVNVSSPGRRHQAGLLVFMYVKARVSVLGSVCVFVCVQHADSSRHV